MRRNFALAAALVMCSMGADALAEGYPSKPIRLVVGFSPAGPRTLLRGTSARAWATHWASPSSSKTVQAQDHPSPQKASPNRHPTDTAC